MEALAVDTPLASALVAIAIASTAPSSVVGPFVCGNKLRKHVIGEIHKCFHLFVACGLYVLDNLSSANAISASRCSSAVSVFSTA